MRRKFKVVYFSSLELTTDFVEGQQPQLIVRNKTEQKISSVYWMIDP